MSLSRFLRSLTSRPAHARPFVPSVRLWKRGVGVAAAAVLVSTALVAQGGVTTAASWNDTEWVHSSAVTTVDCENPEGTFATRGEGRLLSGSLLGIDLDTIVAANGVEATNDGTRTAVDPSGAIPVIDPPLSPAEAPTAFANPVDVSALNSALTVDLSGVLQLPLDTSTGSVGQYGQAASGGEARGASGLITSSGGVATSPTNEYPDLATLKLSTLLGTVNPSVAALLGNVTDVSLTTGAVAGSAALDGCALSWTDDSATAVSREYLTSHIYTDVASPTIGSVATTVDGTLGTLQTTANGLIGNGSLLSGVVSGVVTLVDGLLGNPLISAVLGIRTTPNGTTAGITAVSLDLAPVQSLVNTPFEDEHGVVSISLDEGLVRVNTTALLGEAYGDTYTDGANELPPNSDLLADQHVVDTLTRVLGETLDTLVSRIVTALNDVIDTAVVSAVISIPLQTRCLLLCTSWTDAGAIGVSIHGSVAALKANTPGTVTVDTSALNVLGLGTLLGGLVNGIVSGLTSTVGSAIGTIVDDALTPVLTAPVSTILSLVDPIVSLVGNVYAQLYQSGVVSLTVNAQNEPADWSGLDPGRYDVAALRIGVLDALGQSNVRLYLGRASVGPGCSVSMAAQPGNPCAGY